MRNDDYDMRRSEDEGWNARCPPQFFLTRFDGRGPYHFIHVRSPASEMPFGRGLIMTPGWPGFRSPSSCSRPSVPPSLDRTRPAPHGGPTEDRVFPTSYWPCPCPAYGFFLRAGGAEAELGWDPGRTARGGAELEITGSA